MLAASDALRREIEVGLGGFPGPNSHPLSLNNGLAVANEFSPQGVEVIAASFQVRGHKGPLGGSRVGGHTVNNQLGCGRQRHQDGGRGRFGSALGHSLGGRSRRSRSMAAAGMAAVAAVAMVAMVATVATARAVATVMATMAPAAAVAGATAAAMAAATTGIRNLRTARHGHHQNNAIHRVNLQQTKREANPRKKTKGLEPKSFPR